MLITTVMNLISIHNEVYSIIDMKQRLLKPSPGTICVILIHENSYYSLYEEFEVTKGVIRIRQSKKDRQYNGQKKKNKMTSSDLQSTMQKTNDWVTWTPLKPEMNSCRPLVGPSWFSCYIPGDKLFHTSQVISTI